MRFPRALAIPLLFILAGCASDPQTVGDIKALRGMALAAVGHRSVRAQTNLTPNAILASIRFAKVRQPLLLVQAKKTGALATVSVAAQDGDVWTWLTADGVSLTFRRGVLIATRGLGGDLMSGDVHEVLTALRSGGRAVRTYRWLDGEDQIFAQTFVCTYKPQGLEVLQIAGHTLHLRRVDERCVNATTQISNSYWIGREDKVIWKSYQWVGAYAGTLSITRLAK